jgi:hypothetical protein
VLLLFCKAFLGLLAFDVLDLVCSFGRMHRVVRGWKVSSRPAIPGAVDRVCKAVNYACVAYPKRVLCRQRSAVTTCLLRSLGVSAQMVMGAQKVPFMAHAWTEVAGHPVNERRDVRRVYSILERC